VIEAVENRMTEMFGFYELDDDGNILYSRVNTGQNTRTTNNQVVGQNFFREVAGFENSEDLRQHFRRFLSSRSPADTFRFDCLFGSHTVPARITLTKGHESDAEGTAGIVIMDIREAAV
jgi:hypothetical protein